MADDLTELADKVALRELVDAYARDADRRDGAALANLFTADGVLRIVRAGSADAPVERRGRDDIAAAIARLDRYRATFHLVGNQYVTVDGDDARGEVYCLAHHLDGSPDRPVDHVMVIRYHDRYRREPDGWRIAERELRVDWTEARTVTSP